MCERVCPQPNDCRKPSSPWKGWRRKHDGQKCADTHTAVRYSILTRNNNHPWKKVSLLINIPSEAAQNEAVKVFFVWRRTQRAADHMTWLTICDQPQANRASREEEAWRHGYQLWGNIREEACSHCMINMWYRNASTAFHYTFQVLVLYSYFTPVHFSLLFDNLLTENRLRNGKYFWKTLASSLQYTVRVNAVCVSIFTALFLDQSSCGFGTLRRKGLIES